MKQGFVTSFDMKKKTVLLSKIPSRLLISPRALFPRGKLVSWDRLAGRTNVLYSQAIPVLAGRLGIQ